MSARLFYPLLIISLGFLVYSNAFLNPFVWDDNTQIVDNPYLHSINAIPSLFISSMKDSASYGGFLGIYYKPIFFPPIHFFMQ